MKISSDLHQSHGVSNRRLGRGEVALLAPVATPLPWTTFDQNQNCGVKCELFWSIYRGMPLFACKVWSWICKPWILLCFYIFFMLANILTWPWIFADTDFEIPTIRRRNIMLKAVILIGGPQKGKKRNSSDNLMRRWIIYLLRKVSYWQFDNHNKKLQHLLTTIVSFFLTAAGRLKRSSLQFACFL